MEVRARNVGVAALPEVGPAQTVLAACVCRPSANIPELVTGDPLTLRMDAGAVRATLVTEPAVETATDTVSPPVLVSVTLPLPETRFRPACEALFVPFVWSVSCPVQPRLGAAAESCERARTPRQRPGYLRQGRAARGEG